MKEKNVYPYEWYFPLSQNAQILKQSIGPTFIHSSSNIFTKFDQNPTHSKRDISHKSGTDRQTHRQTHRQIKLGGATVYQTVTINNINVIMTP